MKAWIEGRNELSSGVFVLHMALELLNKAIDLWKSNAAAYALFELPKTYLSRVETQRYPRNTQKLVGVIGDDYA